MGTGEIRLSILWECVYKGAIIADDDLETGTKAGDVFSASLFKKLLEEEYEKLLQADNIDVFNTSKITTLPISKEITIAYINSEVKLPWFIDLLNINLK